MRSAARELHREATLQSGDLLGATVLISHVATSDAAETTISWSFIPTISSVPVDATLYYVDPSGLRSDGLATNIEETRVIFQR